MQREAERERAASELRSGLQGPRSEICTMHGSQEHHSPSFQESALLIGLSTASPSKIDPDMPESHCRDRCSKKMKTGSL